MNFQLEERDEVVIFTVLDRAVEGRTAAEFKAKMVIVAQPEAKAFILDLTKVELMDSSGLGALLLAYRQHKESDTPVILVGVQDFVKSLLHITQIENIFHYNSTVEKAIKSLE